MMEKFLTIARGTTPEDAFWVAQNMGFNEPAIKMKEYFEVYEIPNEVMKWEYIFWLHDHLEDLKTNEKKAACVQIQIADSKAPIEHYFISGRLNAYVFFGFEL